MGGLEMDLYWTDLSRHLFSQISNGSYLQLQYVSSVYGYTGFPDVIGEILWNSSDIKATW